jgi:hypothetical protein
MFARDPEFEVLGEAADGAEAVRLALALAPAHPVTAKAGR